MADETAFSPERAAPTEEFDWADAVVLARTLRGWSQRELAKRANLSASAVARQERGEARPSRASRQKIERALGIEGIVPGLRTFFGRLRANFNAGRSIQGVAALASQIVEGWMAVGLAELEVLEEASEKEDSARARLEMFLEEFRRERRERERLAREGGRSPRLEDGVRDEEPRN